MLNPRIIPCLLLQNGNAINTINFKYDRYIGCPINAARIFSEKKADELIVLDIDKTVKNLEPDYEKIRLIAKQCTMPMCYGGGIKNIAQIRRIIALGVEKVALSSAVINNLDLLYEAINIVGKQSIVVVLDIRKNDASDYEIYTHNGMVATGIHPSDFIRKLNEIGVGEIIVNSIDRDGTMSGYDLVLLEQIMKTIGLMMPITILGGARTIGDIQNVLSNFNISGVAASSLFLYSGPLRAVLINYPDIKTKDKIFNNLFIGDNKDSSRGLLSRMVGVGNDDNLKVFHSPNSIIILKVDAIGDFIIWLDSAKEIKNKYPNARITLIYNQVYFDIVKNISYFDSIIPVNFKNILKISYLISLIKKIRQTRYDLYICPMATRNLFTEFFTFFVRANSKISTKYKFGKFKCIQIITDKFYTALFGLSKNIKNEFEYNAEFLAKALQIYYLPGSYDLSFLTKNVSYPNLRFDKYVVVNLSSSALVKNWPLDNFVEVIKYLLESVNVVLVGVKSEKILGDFVYEEIKSSKFANSFQSLIGKTTLIETMAIVKNATCVIGNDSALIHIAESLQVASIAILGGGDYGRFLPYTSRLRNYSYKQIVITSDIHRNVCFNCDWKCIYPRDINKPWPCVSSVTTKQVIDAFQKIHTN